MSILRSNRHTKEKQSFQTAFSLVALLLTIITVIPDTYAEEDKLTGREIVKQCGYKNPGKDQISTFTVILTDDLGNQKKSVYLRLWKDYQETDGIVDKMILFTEYPPDAKGTAFMRIAYSPDDGKYADQWVYLPLLAKTRRVTIRDPGDSFLNSDLTHADVSYHRLDDENYEFTGIKSFRGIDNYVVEAVPKNKGQKLYTKRVLWFSKTPNWDKCANVRIDYYDSRGDLLKEQDITWQQIKDAWIWDKVVVRNIQTSHTSELTISDVDIDTGLQDRIFSVRTLKIGPSAVDR